MPRTRGSLAESLALAAIIALAAAARLWAADWGLPLFDHPDEHLVVEPARRIAEGGDLRPARFTYPPLPALVTSGVLAALGVIGVPIAGAEGRTLAYTAARCTTALLGAGAVWATARAARELWGSGAGLGAAFLLGVAFLHVQQSHYAKPDVPASLWTAACLWASAAAMAGRGRRRRLLLAAGATAGLAAASKYNAGLAVVTPLAASLAATGRSPSRDGAGGRLGARAVDGAAVVAGAAVAFLAAVPWLALEPSAVVRDVMSEMAHYRRGHFGAEGEPGLENGLYYLRTLAWSGLSPGLALAVVVGAVAAWRRDRRVALVLLAFPVAYLALLAGVRVRFERNLVPMLPALAALGGLGIAALLAGARRIRPALLRLVAGSVLLLVVVAWPIFRVVLYDRAMSRPGTLRQLLDWHWATSARHPTACIDLLRPWRARVEGFDVVGSLGSPLPSYAARGCDVLAVTSTIYGPVLDAPERHPELAPAYRELLARPPLAELRHSRDPIVVWALGEEIEVHAPVVRVYDLRGGGPSGGQR